MGTNSKGIDVAVAVDMSDEEDMSEEIGAVLPAFEMPMMPSGNRATLNPNAPDFVPDLEARMLVAKVEEYFDIVADYACWSSAPNEELSFGARYDAIWRESYMQSLGHESPVVQPVVQEAELELPQALEAQLELDETQDAQLELFKALEAQLELHQLHKAQKAELELQKVKEKQLELAEAKLNATAAVDEDIIELVGDMEPKSPMRGQLLEETQEIESKLKGRCCEIM